MRLSTDRILTTHVGSLPRPRHLLDLLYAKDRGELADRAALDGTVREAVATAVARQIEAGIDIVNDGEMSKIGYATYVKDRLEGFSGDTPHWIPADLADYPAYRERITAAGDRPQIRRPLCTGPIAVKDDRGLVADIANLTAAMAGTGAVEGFLSAASPGVITAFQPNQHYPTHEAYLEALAVAMKAEYEAIAGAGFVLQLDCPDLAMGRHTAFKDIDEAAFLRHAEQQVEALNHSLADVPAENCRLHLCWGNYEGPHTHDIGLDKILGLVLKAKPAGISFEASNPRHAHEWALWAEADIPEDKVLLPGVIDTLSNYVEHPGLVAERICRFADIVGRERVIAGTDCGFGTFAGFGRIDHDICYAKLAATAEGAASASERLW
jgi:5-methyltetrahydropteroyltriglutamate--homocysteine methyltransferase